MIGRKRNRLYNAVDEALAGVLLPSKDGFISLSHFPKELVAEGIELCMPVPYQPEFHLLHKCAKLIGLTTGVPYDEQGKIKVDISADLRNALPTVIAALQHIDKHHHGWVDVYSPSVALLIDEFKRLSGDKYMYNQPEALVRRPSERPGEFKWVRVSHLINEFFLKVRKVLHSKKFRSTEANWLGEYRRRMESTKAYVDALFKAYSKLLVIRVDLYQEKYKGDELLRRCEEGGWQTPVGELDGLRAKVDQLLANSRHNKIFERRVGFIIKQEYAPIRGWHAHAIFFFNGQEVENDSYFSVAIGDYWVDVVTQGEGAYRAANRPENKSRYRYCGIGMIDHRDTAKRDILINRVIDYLAKSDLHVRSKGYAGQKLFRKGVAPKQPERRRGRPRLPAGQSSAVGPQQASV